MSVTHNPKAGDLAGEADWLGEHNVSLAAADVGAEPEGTVATHNAATNVHGVADTTALVTMAQVIDTLYPVGSIYTATVSTNPATLFGRGTWTAFGAGRVLIGNDGATYATDEATGGGATAAVSAHSGTAVADHAALTHSGATVADHAALSHSAHAGATVGNHTFTQPGAHSNHTVTQPSAHADNIAHTHVLQVQGGTTAATTGTHVMTSTATGGSVRAIATGDNVGSSGTGASLTHTGTAVDAHSAHSGGAVDAHTVGQASAHSDHALQAHTVGQASAHAALVHSVTQPGDHTAVSTIQPYVVVHMWKRTA